MCSSEPENFKIISNASRNSRREINKEAASTNSRALVELPSGVLLGFRDLDLTETTAAMTLDRRWRRIVVVEFERAITDPVASLTASEAVSGLHCVVTHSPTFPFPRVLIWAKSLWLTIQALIC